MQMPPRTPEDRTAIAQRTHHPVNTALNRRAAPSAHAPRSTTSKTYRDRIDSRGSAGSTPDKGSKSACRGDPGSGHTQRHQSKVQSKWMGLVSHPSQARCSRPSLNQFHPRRSVIVGSRRVGHLVSMNLVEGCTQCDFDLGMEIPFRSVEVEEV